MIFDRGLRHSSKKVVVTQDLIPDPLRQLQKSQRSTVMVPVECGHVKASRIERNDVANCKDSVAAVSIDRPHRFKWVVREGITRHPRDLVSRSEIFILVLLRVFHSGHDSVTDLDGEQVRGSALKKVRRQVGVLSRQRDIRKIYAVASVTPSNRQVDRLTISGGGDSNGGCQPKLKLRCSEKMSLVPANVMIRIDHGAMLRSDVSLYDRRNIFAFA